jgi:hypothetical protein
MAIVRTTGFDPAIHGFHFRNRFSGRDIIEAVNVGLGSLATTVANDAEFWKGWGLCGGMSWSALDRFYDDDPVPESAESPVVDSELFRHLVDRQLDSFRGAALITQCLRWQSRYERRPWWDPRNTTWRLTRRQWPKVKELIDRGHPASLTLIRSRTDASANHQVLAVGYCEDASGLASIDLYDPNHPGETPKIVLRLAGAEAGRAIQSSGEPLRGFFSWAYGPPHEAASA